MTISESIDDKNLANSSITSKQSLFVLYFATFIMRAAAYLSIAVITSNEYLETGVSNLTVGAIIAFYPLAEVLTVMFFGIGAILIFTVNYYFSIIINEVFNFF